MPVDSKHPQYSDHIKNWETCRLFYLGEEAVKSAGTRFLPKPEGSTLEEYKSYVLRAGFFPAVERTVSGLSGVIARKEPTVSVPSRIAYIKDNADSNMATLAQFSKIVLDAMFLTGRCGILCERDVDGSPPYLVLYDAEQIINWSIDSEQRLLMVVLEEWYYQQSPTDEFVQDKRKRYRVLKLEEGRYIQRIYEVPAVPGISSSIVAEPIQVGGDIEIQKAGVPLTEIPFVFCNVRSITTKIDKPPLLDLVLRDAEYYRTAADYNNSLYFTGNPILVAKGVKKPKTPRRKPMTPQEVSQNVAGQPIEYNEPDFQVTIGSTRAVFIPVDASVELVECKGHGVEPNRQRLQDLKEEMAILGARLLEGQRAGVEAAETAKIRQSGETSTLSNIVTNGSAAIKKALIMLDEWQGGKGDEVEFHLNDDFIDVTLNPQLLAQLADLVAKELISWDTFYYNLAKGELTVPSRSAEDERKEIEKQPPIGGADPNDLSGLNQPPVGTATQSKQEQAVVTEGE